MIPRILVPKNARPVASPSDAPPKRLSSDMDSRTLVPSNLPQFELDPHSSIPSYFKLEVLGAPVVVPRDNMPNTPLDAVSKTPNYVPLTILDSRVAVPKDAHSAKLEPKQLTAIQDLPDLIDPDVLTTGEVNLMAHPVEQQTAKWNAFARLTGLAFELLLVALILYGPRLPQQQARTEIARDNITDLYMPNNLDKLLKAPSPPQPKSPQMRIDPRLLRQLAPPHAVEAPSAPPQPVVNNPAPKPAAPTEPITPPRVQQPIQDSPIRPPQTPPDSATHNLILPNLSPGKFIERSMQDALKDGGGQSAQFGGSIPGGEGGMGGGGGGAGQAYGAVELLTPTEGVDFSTYIARVLASVKRNWYAVMPESAQLGEKGRVVLQFRIMRNGVVPEPEPAMVGSSGKDPLDRAAVSSIRASTPFEPLPTAFTGPFIELRFIFLYNIPLSQAQ